jgi:hypothetical protein
MTQPARTIAHDIAHDRVLGCQHGSGTIVEGVMLSGRRAREQAEEQARERVLEAADRAAAAHRVHDTLAAQINDAIVHTVGAQQALVRGAHADDVLFRLRAAEESAREALSDLERLVALIAR